MFIYHIRGYHWDLSLQLYFTHEEKFSKEEFLQLVYSSMRDSYKLEKSEIRKAFEIQKKFILNKYGEDSNEYKSHLSMEADYTDLDIETLFISESFREAMRDRGFKDLESDVSYQEWFGGFVETEDEFDRRSKGFKEFLSSLREE